jgi:two-component system, OmpR family, sensor histidine kinase BaeS
MRTATRLKLVHQLSLLLAGAALAAVLAMSAVIWWNLRAGFSDYLAARDTPQLARLSELLTTRSESDPDFNWLRGSREGMESLLTDFRGYERRGGPPPPDSIEGWIQIYDAKGEWLAGRPQPGKPSRIWTVAVRSGVIAQIRLFRNEPTSAVDAAFLRRQYLGLGLAGLAVLALSLLAAWWSARRWAQPLKSLQNVTKLVAAGDLTQRTKPEGTVEIAALMADVNTMTESLDRLQKARRLWIAQISHELRTPLSVLRGELEAVQDGARKPDEVLIKNLLGEVLHLGRLVGDLHTLSMADVGQLHCEFQAQEVSQEIMRIAKRYAAIAESHGLMFHIGLQGSHIMATWDMRRITQVLTNLLANSERYTDSPGRIELAWQVRHDVFELTIEDTAPSVPKHALEQMFEPLYRADSARTRQSNSVQDTGGSGLGLAIVRAIVLAHQGSIHASLSSLGGIKITLILPLNPTENR